MAEPTIQLGGGNWAGKTDNLLGYYKEGERFYKQDFTFSRSTTGTYTDSDGYIQEMPYNLLQQSNDFDTTWLTQDANVTSNEVGYDGSNDAWLFSWTSSTAFLYQSISLKASENTISIYAKQGTSSNLRLDFVTAGFSKGASCTFDLSNGTAGSVVQYGSSTDFTAAIDSVGSGWYRISLSGTTTATTWYHELALTSGSVYIQNAQLVKGSSAKTYFPTTTRLNMPRVDYLNNSNGSLILEPQRSNLITNSNSNSLNFTLDNVSMTYNSIISPDGETNGILFEQTGSANSNSAYNYGLTTTDGTYSYSLFIKAKDSTQFRFYSSNGASTLVQDFNPLEMTEGILSGNLNLKFEDYGNGWFRVSFTRTLSSAAFHRLQIYPDRNNTQKGVYIFGLQVESGGNYATSYIPTSGSSVTRNADACSISNVADRIGQTEGTVYVEFKSLTILGNQHLLDVSDNSSSDRVGLQIASTVINAFRVSPSDTTSLISSSTISENTLYKCAFAYENGRHAFYLNGSKIGEDTNLITSMSLNKIDVGQRFNGTEKFNGSIIDSKLYSTALTDAELATLTT